MYYKRIIVVVVISVLCISAVVYDQSFTPTSEQLVVVLSSGPLPPRPFMTDGCSMWPNRFGAKDLTGFCIEHDNAYWRGGTRADRKAADQRLRDMVNENIPLMGTVIYIGVRVGGHPLMPVPWRWGYGHEYPYMYSR